MPPLNDKVISRTAHIAARDLSGGAITGIILGSLLGVGLLVLVVCFSARGRM